MGAYLTQPLTEKHSEDGEGNKVKFGASCMQGWRITQEDAHNCVVGFDDKSSVFAVYDGHGGAEVATFLSRHFPDFLKDTEGYKNGDMEKALNECFVKIDEYVKSEKGLAEVQQLALEAKNLDKEKEEEGTVDEEDMGALYAEADMPIEELVEKYKSTPMFPKLAGVEGEDRKEMPGPSNGVSKDKDLTKCVDLVKLIGSRKVEDGKERPSDEVSKGKDSIEAEIEETTDKVELAGAEEVEDSKGKPGPANEVSKSKDSIDTEIEESTDKVKLAGVEEVEDSKEKPESCNGISKHNDSIEAEIEESTDQVKSEKSILVNGQADAAAAREESILVETTPTKVRKGKSHPPIPVPVPVTRSSDRKLKVKEKKIYKEFVNAESGTSDSEDCEDESYVGIGNEMSESDDSGEAGTGELENSDDTSEAEDGDDGEEEESDEDEEDDDDEEDDEDLLSDVQEPGFDSGCTAVVAFLKWQIDTGLLDLWVANAGDSRCTVSRGGKAWDMSKDHKPEDDIEAKRIVRAGGKVTMDGRVNGGLNLSRAIGDHSYKQNTTLPLEEQMITPVPDIQYLALDPSQDDFIVLACDGVWNSLSSQEVVDFVAEKLTTENTLSGICEQLFDKCLATDTSGDGTGCDNMTAVIIKIGPNECNRGSGKRVRSSPSPPPPEDCKKLKVDVELTN